MADNQSSGMCQPCYIGGLSGCGMHCSLAAALPLVGKSGFVEEHVYAVYLFGNRGFVHRIGAVGVTFAGLAVAVMLREEESAAGHFMVQGNRLHRYRAVRKDDFAFAGIDSVEDELVVHLGAVVV